MISGRGSHTPFEDKEYGRQAAEPGTEVRVGGGGEE